MRVVRYLNQPEDMENVDFSQIHSEFVNMDSVRQTTRTQSVYCVNRKKIPVFSTAGLIFPLNISSQKLPEKITTCCFKV